MAWIRPQSNPAGMPTRHPRDALSFIAAADMPHSLAVSKHVRIHWDSCVSAVTVLCKWTLSHALQSAAKGRSNTRKHIGCMHDNYAERCDGNTALPILPSPSLHVQFQPHIMVVQKVNPHDD